jgi:hypothetical protein
MTDRKDEAGNGPGKPGEGPRRPYATIDLQATEVSAESNKPAAGDESPAAGPSEDEAARPSLGARLAGARDWARSTGQGSAVATHVGAGVAGGIVTLGAAALFGLLPSDGQQVAPGAGKRIAALEDQLRQRPAAGDVNAKLTQAESRLKGLEEQARTVAALNDAQSKLAANVKALEGRGSSPEVTNRLSKIETTVAALSGNDRSGQSAALADKLTTLEKQVGDALEASKASSERIDRMLADAKTQAGDLGKRLDALRADVDERLKGSAKGTDVSVLSAKIGAFERDLQGFLKGEGERTSNAQRVLLSLEIGNLKRTMDRGEPFAEQLKAVRRLAGNTFNVAPLERYAQDGVPTLLALSKEFRQVADTAADTEAEPTDGSVLDRLMSGARSIVRVRKAGYDPNDTSTEAVLGRMETALKDGRLDEVMAQGSKLPPKAALVAEDWLKKVEARRTVDQAIADIEMAMKTSLTAGPAPAAEPKR